MQVDPLCIPCVLDQAYRAIRMVSDDPQEQMDFIREMAGYIAENPPDGSPAEYSSPVYHRLSEKTGIADLFVEIKKEQNQLALALLDHVEQAVRRHPTPLLAAARVAGAGNLIDSGVGVPEDVEPKMIAAADHPFARDETERFLAELPGADSLLFIHDNAGEIVFDGLFIQLLKEAHPHLKITACVKGGPVLNDALEEDARMAGIYEKADAVITTGSNRVGTPLNHIGPECRDALQSHSLFLCKGQGNFETLNEVDGGYLLLTAKCSAVARKLGVELKQMAFAPSGRAGGFLED